MGASIIQARRQGLATKLASMSDDALRAADGATLARSYGLAPDEVARRLVDTRRGRGL